MKGASRIVAEILLELRQIVRDGITTAEIDRLAEDMTRKKKAIPAFKGYRGFPASICISINDEVVRQHLSGQDEHGRPFTMGVYPMLLDETCHRLDIDPVGTSPVAANRSTMVAPIAFAAAGITVEHDVTPRGEHVKLVEDRDVSRPPPPETAQEAAERVNRRFRPHRGRNRHKPSHRDRVGR